MTGLSQRLQKDMNSFPEFDSVKVISLKYHLYHAWTGGTTYQSELTTEKQWMIKEMYDEYGPNIVNQMC